MSTYSPMGYSLGQLIGQGRPNTKLNEKEMRAIVTNYSFMSNGSIISVIARKSSIRSIEANGTMNWKLGQTKGVAFVKSTDGTRF